MDEADDFWNAGECTSEDLLKGTAPPILSKLGSSAGEVIRRWGWTCQSSTSLPSSRVPRPSLFNSLNPIFSDSSQLCSKSTSAPVQTPAHTFVRWVSCGSISAALPRITKANSLRTITPFPTDGTAGALCSIIPYPPDRWNSHTSSIAVSFFSCVFGIGFG